jgi:hypothetical protein
MRFYMDCSSNNLLSADALDTNWHTRMNSHYIGIVAVSGHNSMRRGISFDHNMNKLKNHTLDRILRTQSSLGPFDPSSSLTILYRNL